MVSRRMILPSSLLYSHIKRVSILRLTPDRSSVSRHGHSSLFSYTALVQPTAVTIEMKYMIILRIIKNKCRGTVARGRHSCLLYTDFMKSDYCSIVPQSTSTQSLTVQVIDAVPKAIGLSGLSEPGPVMVTEILY